MPDLQTLESGEIITVKTYKIVPNAEIAWANTYEFVSISDITDPISASNALKALADTIRDFEVSILVDSFVFDRVVLSTYVPDGVPYNPYSFVSVPYNKAGDYYVPGATPLPLQFAVLVKRQVNYGRQGNLLLRGAANVQDVQISSGGAVISLGRLNTLRTAVDNFLVAIAGTNFRMVMVSGSPNPDPNTLRPVDQLSVKEKMSFKKLNNRYFDRTRQ
jgi:hypothetical protein